MLSMVRDAKGGLLSLKDGRRTPCGASPKITAIFGERL